MTRSRAVDRPSLLKAEGPERLVHRGRRGADLKHRARDALGLADLRLFGLQHASMLRGVGVRGSFGAQERPARPRSLSGAAETGLGTAAYPAPVKEYGR